MKKKNITHASLFSGIGGPEVAAAMLGWQNAFHCEINPFGKAVLDYWFPNSQSYEDITKTDFRPWRGRVCVLTGGFPCQPFSYAGKRGGQEDERYLWPQMLRAIDEIRPTWVVGENVAGITTMVEGWLLTEMGGGSSLFEEDKQFHDWNLEQTFTIEKIAKELEGIGYSVQPVLIPAAAVGAPHRRDRIFILAHEDADRLRREDDTSGIGRHDQKHRDARSGDSQRLRPEAGSDAPHSRDAGPQGQRKRKAKVHSPGPAANSDAFRKRLATTIQQGCYGEEERDGEGRSVVFTSDDAWIKGAWWDNFPTVSPVHSGNDGLSIRLDGISLPASMQPRNYRNSNCQRFNFGKWRTESIKAYGNAIVPQVMYEIFRFIEIIETNEQ